MSLVERQAEEVGPKGTVLWDRPTRIFHWSLALTVAAAWLTATEGWVVIHRVCGYVVLVLVLFRIYWGFRGAASARFSTFLRGPGAALTYARAFVGRRTQPSVGHNPLGGWAILAMLTLLLLQAGLGLFAVDEFGVHAGPLASRLTFVAARRVAAWHALAANLLWILIGLHLAAIVLHRLVLAEDLVTPMLTGRRAGGVAPPLEHNASRVEVGLVLAGLAGVVSFLALFG